MENTEKKIHISDIVFIIVFLLLLALPAYLAYQVLVAKNKPADTQIEQIDVTPSQSEENQNNPTDTVEPVDPKYVEIVREISGQNAYIAIPTNIDPTNLPPIILYSHDSNTRVISDMYDPFMIDLKGYGKYFSEQNYIFAASNEHDENWGNAASVSDILTLQQWIQGRYTTNGKIYLIGFNMGALPTMHFAAKYPDDIIKIALLAPTTRTYEWTQTDVDKIMDIGIQIWHGTSDINARYSNSIDFVQYMKELGKDISLITLEGKTHFDLDTEYMGEILQYFKTN